jgi:DTW domain-containing protein YfiP
VGPVTVVTEAGAEYTARLFFHLPDSPVVMPQDTSVTRLRRAQLAKSTRAFVARGSRLSRCDHCLLASSHCVCRQRPQVSADCAFLFLMYQGEVFKPSNTGRLIADVVADNYAWQWSRTEHDDGLLALLADEAYAPVVVFPHEYAEAERCICAPQQLPGVTDGTRKPLFIMLDGTWREARKMFRSEYLRHLPVLGIQPQQASDYRLREAFHEHQLCTAEVGMEVLRLNGDDQAAEALQAYFLLFREQYLATKANRGNPAQ